MAELLKECVRRLLTWKEAMEKKGLRVNAGKTKIMISGTRNACGLKRLTKDPDYRCTRYQGTAHPLDSRPQKEVQVRPDKLEVVASFCYLGDMLSAAGGCELSTTTHMKTAWRSSRIYQFSLHATSLSRHMVMCTALVCRAQCSMPVRLDH